MLEAETSPASIGMVGEALAAMAMGRHPVCAGVAAPSSRATMGPSRMPAASDSSLARLVASSTARRRARLRSGSGSRTPNWKPRTADRVAGHRAERSENAAGAVDGAHGHLQLVGAHLGGHPLMPLVEEVLHRDPHRLHLAPRAVDSFDGDDRRGGQLGAGAQCGRRLVAHRGERDLELALVGRPGGDARSHHFELRVLGHRVTLPPPSRPAPGGAPGAPTGVQPRIS